MGNLASQLVDAGADGLVLFNRFYQPDVDPETLEVRPMLSLSSPAELRLPLRWIGILHGQLEASLAASSGIHSGVDAVKALAADPAAYERANYIRTLITISPPNSGPARTEMP
jgi:dihydroorotate dehydrogenase (fumarate)